jgi:serine/threonine protein kinase
LTFIRFRVFPMAGCDTGSKILNQIIDDFEIVRELGRGGMGVVYEAIEIPLKRRVAFKMLHPQWAAHADSASRFISEAQKVAKLSHPAIVSIHRFGKADGTYYLALEYVDGTTLDSMLSHERISQLATVRILKEVSGALHHAHQSHIVHRDIKPGNIFIRTDGSAVVGDFGIAKDFDASAITQEGIIMGTPAYMSPEQVMAEPVSPASDLYSLGIVAFEMVTGRGPFKGATAAVVGV